MFDDSNVQLTVNDKVLCEHWSRLPPPVRAPSNRRGTGWEQQRLVCLVCVCLMKAMFSVPSRVKLCERRSRHCPLLDGLGTATFSLSGLYMFEESDVQRTLKYKDLCERVRWEWVRWCWKYGLLFVCGDAEEMDTWRERWGLVYLRNHANKEVNDALVGGPTPKLLRSFLFFRLFSMVVSTGTWGAYFSSPPHSQCRRHFLASW